jgi:hypothetical protein
VSKSNVHESSDWSGLPTLELDSGSEGTGSSRQLSSRSPKKKSQEKQNSSPKKALSQRRLAPPHADKRQQEEPTIPKKSLAQFKLAPSLADKRYGLEYRSSSTRMVTIADSQKLDLPRNHSDRHMDSAKMNSSAPRPSLCGTPRTPNPPPRRRRMKAPVNKGSPTRTMDDFFT